jgi:hypothetical protein
LNNSAATGHFVSVEMKGHSPTEQDNQLIDR